MMEGAVAMRCGPKCVWAGRATIMSGLAVAIWALFRGYSSGEISRETLYLGLNGASLAAGGTLAMFRGRQNGGPQQRPSD